MSKFRSSGPVAGEPMLTTADIAAKLQVSEKLVRGWIRSGKLRARKLGKAWRVSRAALDDFLEAR